VNGKCAAKECYCHIQIACQNGKGSASHSGTSHVSGSNSDGASGNKSGIGGNGRY